MSTRVTEDSLSAAWLATRLGAEPFKLDAMRRAGELIGYRPEGSREYYYPLWQFDEEWQPLPIIPQLVREGGARGLRGNRLYEVLNARAGVTSGRRLGESLREGRLDHVLDALRSARP